MPAGISTETLEQTIEDIFDGSRNPILNKTNSYFEFNFYNLPKSSPVNLVAFTYKGVQYQVLNHLDHKKAKNANAYREVCDIREVGSEDKRIRTVVVGYVTPFTDESDLKREDNWGIFLLGDINPSRKIAVRSANRKNSTGIDEGRVDKLK